MWGALVQCDQKWCDEWGRAFAVSHRPNASVRLWYTARRCPGTLYMHTELVISNCFFSLGILTYICFISYFLLPTLAWQMLCISIWRDKYVYAGCVLAAKGFRERRWSKEAPVFVSARWVITILRLLVSQHPVCFIVRVMATLFWQNQCSTVPGSVESSWRRPPEKEETWLLTTETTKVRSIWTRWVLRWFRRKKSGITILIVMPDILKKAKYNNSIMFTGAYIYKEFGAASGFGAASSATGKTCVSYHHHVSCCNT